MSHPPDRVAAILNLIESELQKRSSMLEQQKQISFESLKNLKKKLEDLSTKY
jgi:predicted RNA-binding protein with EMAP domain